MRPPRSRPLIGAELRRNLACVPEVDSNPPTGAVMTLTVAHVQPLVALIAGILILIMPRLLNYIVALYLILVGIVGLNAIHHFIR